MNNEIQEALTIQALHMRNEVYFGAGMSQKEFEQTYLNDLGIKENISIDNKSGK